MNRSRTSSKARSYKTLTKPGFQKKMKPRISQARPLEDQAKYKIQYKPQRVSQNIVQNPILTSSIKNQGSLKANQSLILPSSSPHNINQFDNLENHNNSQLNQTVNSLININFKQHFSENCVCNQCTCGRHLCKLHNIKLDLSKNSVYKKDFKRKSSAPTKIVIAEEYPKLTGPYLDFNSTHRSYFTSREGDKIQRPRPEDLLKSEGPSRNLTSYSAQFPGHRGQNQYIKPTNQYYRDKFPLRSKSTYSQHYSNKPFQKDNYSYFFDQIKAGTGWFGDSTYKSAFQHPNPQYHPKKVNIAQKRQINPRFKYQFETTYSQQFIPKQQTVCKSKILLQQKGLNHKTVTKRDYGQNTDFRCLSPDFKTFSASKFSYV